MHDDPQSLRRLIDLVGDALELPASERDAFLVSQCGDDAALLAEARELLLHEVGSLSDNDTDPLCNRVTRAAADTAAVYAHPGQIGPYQVLEVLGEGGMGMVYGARQHSPIQRDVAIKVVRTGLVSSSLLARFEAERQTLARLDHPDIARVYDAGATPDGQPYLVMEWVHGEPITRYCTRHQLDLASRLQLFSRVCLAVHHAHQKAIVHRDLKPSNVLVIDLDGAPAPRVIDFGVARVMARDGAPDTAPTAQGTVLGTLEYMSPEQAAWSGAEVDVRSDVYSLGVMLYELLTGELPFPSEMLRTASPVEVQRLLRDTDPLTPSQRVTPRAGNVGPGDGDQAAPSLALSREIDWVVMTALEKDPDRRYQSAHALALDLGRLHRHEAVAAAPPNLGYRTLKFIRRHRAAALAGAAASLALLGGGVAATVGFVKAARARDVALVEAEKSAAVSGFLTSMFASVEPDRARGNVVTVLGVLDSAAARLDRDRPFADQTDVEATIRFSIGNSYRELGEYQAAIPMLARALEIWQAILDPDDERIAEALHGLGNAHWRRGDLEESLDYAAQVLAFRARTVGRMHLKYSEAVHVLGNSHADLGHFAVAESLYREAVWIDSMVLEGPQRERLATSLNNLATVLVDQERPDEAVQVFEQAMAIRREYLHPDDPQIGITLANLGHAILLAGRAPHAIDTLEMGAAFLERVYGPEHVHTASAWRRLGEAYLRNGQLDEALAVLDRSLATYRLRTGETSYRVGQVLLRRGEVRATAGDRAAGLAEMEQGWQMILDGLQAGHPITRSAAITIADLLAAYGDVGRAATWRARGES